LLARDDQTRTAWQVAAEWGKTESEKIWEWAKVEISTEDLNNKLLLAKDDIKQTVWHYAHCGTTYNCEGEYGNRLKSN